MIFGLSAAQMPTVIRKSVNRLFNIENQPFVSLYKSTVRFVFLGHLMLKNIYPGAN